MEVLNVLVVAVGGLSLVAAIAEIKNRLILRAEAKAAAKAAEAARKAAEAAEAARKAEPSMKQKYWALCKELDTARRLNRW